MIALVILLWLLGFALSYFVGAPILRCIFWPFIFVSAFVILFLMLWAFLVGAPMKGVK